MNDLERALEEQKQQTEPYNQPISGLLGIPLNGQRRIEVANRNAYVYVRLRSNQSEVIQAYNNKVSPAYNLPVLVQREGNRYVVVSVDTERYDNNWASQSPFLPRHGNTHSFDIETGGGGDIVWIYPRQFIPNLVLPSGSSGAGNVIVAQNILENADGTWKYTGVTGTANITTYNPSSPTGAVMVLVYMDALSGNPMLIVNSGTVFSNTITGSSQITPYIPTVTNPATQIPLAAIRLITGTSRLSWDNIYDVRQFIHVTPSGSAGGAGSPLNTGVLDARYLKLDASNDPVTGALELRGVNGLGDNLLLVNFLDSNFNAVRILHRPSGSVVLGDDTVAIVREPNGGAEFPYNALYFRDLETNGKIYGMVFSADKNGATRISAHPYATGTIPNYIWDTDRVRLAGTIHTSFRVSGSVIAEINASGTVLSNGVPLVKEAPTDSLPYVRRNAGWEVASTGSASGDVGGWISDLNTWTFLSADSPSFVVSVNANITGSVGLGMKTQLTHLGSTKNFFITGLSVTGSTSYLNLLGGTDYTLTTGAITNPKYSFEKSPYDFPTSPSKWTVQVTDVTQRVQTPPVTDTWYNLGSISISIPIGIWEVDYVVAPGATNNPAANCMTQATLSTANNTESDPDFTTFAQLNSAFQGIVTVYRRKILSVTSKTTYFLNERARAAAANLQIENAQSKCIINAKCAYL